MGNPRTAADKMSADGVIFNNVYDNGYSNNQVIFSLRDDLKNGRVFKKGAKPLEKSQFIDTGTSMNGDLDINKNIQNFVEYLLNPETQQRIASIDAELGTKHGIELLQAALLKDMTPAEYYQYAKTGGPRLQALMKDNIVSEDEFVKLIMSNITS